jgi:hypothetical protein
MKERHAKRQYGGSTVILSTVVGTFYLQAVCKDSSVAKSVWKKGKENSGGT